MLAFRGLRFQYLLSVSPQEGLGTADLNLWILEVKGRWSSCKLTLVHTGHREGFGAVAQGLLRAPKERSPISAERRVFAREAWGA